MSLTTNVYIEYVDKKLNGSSHYRNNDIPIVIDITSDDNPTLQGTTVEIVFKHYASSSPVTITKTSSGEGSNIVIQENSNTRLLATTNLLASDLTALPASISVRLEYKVNITLPDTDTSYRTIEVGSLVSNPN